MKVKVIAAFNDLTIEDANDRRRAIGDTIEVGDGRAAQLIDLGFAEADETPAPLHAEPVPAPAAIAQPDPEPLHPPLDTIAPAASVA